MYDQPEEDRPPDYTLKHDILLFDWLDKKRQKELMKRRNPKMKSATSMQEVFYNDE